MKMRSVILTLVTCIRLDGHQLPDVEGGRSDGVSANMTMDMTISSACPEGDMDPTCKMLRAFKICGTCAGGDAKLSRIGSRNDGGYAMCTDVPKPDAALSIGINGFDDWGIQISKKYGITTHEYDCTSHKRPVCPSSDCSLKYNDICMRASNEPKGFQATQTLKEMLQSAHLESSNTLLLQIDIEGAEWNVFKSVPPEELKQFTQVIVEFHSLTTPHNPVHLEVAEKLIQHFTVVHTHGNNFAGQAHYGSYLIPNVLEVTYVRNDLVQKLGKCVSTAHPGHNVPNNPGVPDPQPNLPEKRSKTDTAEAKKDTAEAKKDTANAKKDSGVKASQIQLHEGQDATSSRTFNVRYAASNL